MRHNLWCIAQIMGRIAGQVDVRNPPDPGQSGQSQRGHLLFRGSLCKTGHTGISQGAEAPPLHGISSRRPRRSQIGVLLSMNAMGTPTTGLAVVDVVAATTPSGGRPGTRWTSELGCVACLWWAALVCDTFRGTHRPPRPWHRIGRRPGGHHARGPRRRGLWVCHPLGGPARRHGGPPWLALPVVGRPAHRRHERRRLARPSRAVRQFESGDIENPAGHRHPLDSTQTGRLRQDGRQYLRGAKGERWS
jgi:hypothetical protein